MATKWQQTMRSALGILEVPGSGDNLKILAMRDEIAKRYPDMASYCAQYQHDSIPWCGLAQAWGLAMAGLRPVFGDDDVEKFLYARAWLDYGTRVEPQPGALAIFAREGGGHVGTIEEVAVGTLAVLGGNQSDAVNITGMSMDNLLGCVWPNAATDRPMLSLGAEGQLVKEAQELLGIEADGEFGPITDTAVRAFQVLNNLEVDGVIGPETWPMLGEPLAPPSGPVYRSLVGGFYSPDPDNKSLPLSIRANNPGALNTVAWVRATPGFVAEREATAGNATAVFETPEQGVAAWYTLMTKYRAAGATTVGEIIHRYGGGQDYSEYVRVVSQWSGLAFGKEIPLTGDDGTLLEFAKAMFRYEAGRPTPLSDAQIRYGFALARGEIVTGPVVITEPEMPPEVVPVPPPPKPSIEGPNPEVVANVVVALLPWIIHYGPAILEKAGPSIAKALKVLAPAMKPDTTKPWWNFLKPGAK